MQQHTLASSFEIIGVGLHSGETVRMRIRPSAPDSGIRFRRVDLDPVVEIPAHAAFVTDTSLATVLGRGDAVVSTVEHCLAALRSLGVDNAVVEVDGPEAPILDGSSALYVEKILTVGLAAQDAPRRVIHLKKAIRVEQGDKYCVLRPLDRFAVTYSIDFEQGFPGAQHFFLQVTARSFAEELSRARTFGFVRDVEYLRSIGKARGASLENAVALDGGRVVNPEGLRMHDEMVRHKMLDAVGDLALAGYPILGHLVVHKGGHEMHRRLVQTLLDRPDAWELRPAQRATGRQVRVAAGLAAATF